MKLLCKVSVNNRLATGFKPKYVKSTLALCKNPKTPTYSVILFTSQNTTGTKYDLKDNVSQLFTRFVNEGKTTLKFKQPQHDILIQAEPIQLKSFLHFLKRALENKLSDREITCSSVTVMPLAANTAPTKMCIRKRSDYPSKGFPRTLEVLHINDIQRCALDRGILNLQRLKVLDLSYNCIEFLPTELNKLPCLVELDVGHNMLGKGAPKQWSWLGGNFSKTLKVLNLSSNNLRFLPDEIIKLHRLVTLRIDDNNLKLLPSGIGNLSDLQTLTASKNSISCLPGSASKLHLETLDLSENRFREETLTYPQLAGKFPMVRSLKECAARTVLGSRMGYDEEILPRTVVKYLDCAKYCVCGLACFDTFLMSKSMLLLGMVSRDVKMSSWDVMRVPIDSCFCSLGCLYGFRDARGRFTR